MAQKAINLAANCASEQGLQFSSKKTEIVLFSHKRNPNLSSLSINGSKLELSKKAKLLGVTLDSKLTWEPHITRITRKATTALMQCRQIVGRTRGIKPSMMNLSQSRDCSNQLRHETKQRNSYKQEISGSQSVISQQTITAHWLFNRAG